MLFVPHDISHGSQIYSLKPYFSYYKRTSPQRSKKGRLRLGHLAQASRTVKEPLELSIYTNYEGKSGDTLSIPINNSVVKANKP